jgi:lysine/ornithine N-monooxygenase
MVSLIRRNVVKGTGYSKALPNFVEIFNNLNSDEIHQYNMFPDFITIFFL